jgi:hypothetical protein
MPRTELIAEKPAPEQIEVIQQQFPNALFLFSDKIVAPEHTRAEEYLDVFPVHEPIKLPVGQIAGSDVADKTGVPAQVVGVGNKAGFQQLFANAGSRVGRDALDRGQVDPQPGSSRSPFWGSGWSMRSEDGSGGGWGARKNQTGLPRGGTNENVRAD